MNKENKKVLLIDDDDFIRKIYKDRLMADSFEVDEAKSGSEGLEKLKTGKYNVVLLDMVMPDMSGVEVIKKIRSNKKLSGLSIVVLSALGQESDIKEAMDAGANLYVIKDKTTPQELSIIIKGIR